MMFTKLSSVDEEGEEPDENLMSNITGHRNNSCHMVFLLKKSLIHSKCVVHQPNIYIITLAS